MPLAVTLLQILANYGPNVYAAAVAIAHHPDPTKDDFLGLLDSIAKEDYDAIIQARRDQRAAQGTPAASPVKP